MRSVGRFVARLVISVVLGYVILWLGCGVPAYFDTYFTSCGHNAYLWFAPAFVVAWALLTIVPGLRILGTVKAGEGGRHES